MFILLDCNRRTDISIASPRQRFDPLLGTRLLAERAAQGGDLNG
jgi:hypothetical protein